MYEPMKWKEWIARLLFLSIDLAGITLSAILAYYLRDLLPWFETPQKAPLGDYLSLYPLYFSILGLFAYEGLYTQRYDFWHESRLIVRSLFWSFLIVIIYLALWHHIMHYSRAVILLAFLLMVFLLPLLKRQAKITLKRWGLWRKPATIHGNDPLLRQEIYGNPYLGYVEGDPEASETTVFLNAAQHSGTSLRTLIEQELSYHRELLFIPLLNDFVDLTNSQIYEMANTRTNLIRLKNRLKSRGCRWLKKGLDLTLLVLSFPVLLPLLGIVAYLVKRGDPNGSVFFLQERLGEGGEPFVCYKFRTMIPDNDRILEEYLEKHPEEVEYFSRYRKFRNDPRITPIGRYLRKLSLDELPQIFNVLRGEMSFIGPRPYMIEELRAMGTNREGILSVKPGITGLWQVSGRNRLDFEQRMELDLWYIRNWSLWLDLVILVKTVKTVLSREGAY